MKNFQELGFGHRLNNTGHWSDEEHKLFLEGYELFGKHWSKISKYVKSRTTLQCRSHGQKYLNKLKSNKPSRNEKTAESIRSLLLELEQENQYKPEMRSIGVQYGEGMYMPVVKIGKFEV
jgi:SHAQKYF class myb-like DNA-binding protein